MRDLRGHHGLLLTLLFASASSSQFSRPVLMPSPDPAETIQVFESAVPSATPVLTADEVSKFVQSLGWNESLRHQARSFEAGMIEAIELERAEQLKPGVELYPHAALLLLSFAHGSEIPGVRPGSPQRYDAKDTEQAFQKFIEGITAWSPVHLEALRIGEQVLVLTTAGYLYANATNELANQLQGIVGSASPRKASRTRGLRARRGALPHQVREAQRLLGVMGFYDAPFDGIWGPRSRSAMEAFQAVANLPVTGEPDSISLAGLRDEVDLYSTP